MVDEAGDEVLESVEGHEEDDGLVGEVGGWVWGGAFSSSTRADEDLIADRAVRCRDLSEKRSAQGRCDTGQDDSFVAMFAEKGDFFGASAVEVWVALFQSEDGFAFFEGFETHSVELVLGLIGIAGEFAGDLNGGSAGHEFEDWGGNEFVCEDEVGAADGFEGGGSEKVRMARS